MRAVVSGKDPVDHDADVLSACMQASMVYVIVSAVHFFASSRPPKAAPLHPFTIQDLSFLWLVNAMEVEGFFR